MKAKPARVRVQLVEGGPFRLMTPAQAKRLTKAMIPTCDRDHIYTHTGQRVTINIRTVRHK